MSARAAWHQYLSAKRSASKCTSPAYAAVWEQHAREWLDRYFNAVDVDAFLSGPHVWVWRHDADHRPIDPHRWVAPRRKAEY